MTVTQNEQLIINLGKGTRIFEKDHVKKALEAYEVKTGCANYERDNVLLNEMEENIHEALGKQPTKALDESSYVAKKHWTDEFLEKQYKPCEDLIVEQVRQKLLDRSTAGLKKYNTSLEFNNKDNYLKHAQEEAMDLSNYLEKLMQQKEDITQIVASEANDWELGKLIRKIYGK